MMTNLVGVSFSLLCAFCCFSASKTHAYLYFFPLNLYLPHQFYLLSKLPRKHLFPRWNSVNSWQQLICPYNLSLLWCFFCFFLWIRGNKVNTCIWSLTMNLCFMNTYYWYRGFRRLYKLLQTRTILLIYGIVIVTHGISSMRKSIYSLNWSLLMDNFA